MANSSSKGPFPSDPFIKLNNMKLQKHLARLPTVALMFALVGCRSEAPSSGCAGAVVDVQATNLIKFERRIEIDWHSARLCENEKNIFAKAALNRYPTNFCQIQSKAERIKNSICSDPEYLKALQTFSTIASNRVTAIQAELDVYERACEPTM
jgi:hypothetical protein